MTPPPGFHWTTRSASIQGEPPTVIVCDGVWILSLAQRVGDGRWIAALDRHRHGPGGPWRICSSYQQGCAGAELWVMRHEARLREDVAKIARWREEVRTNRLAREHAAPPFGWMGKPLLTACSRYLLSLRPYGVRRAKRARRSAGSCSIALVEDLQKNRPADFWPSLAQRRCTLA